jgi:hypothetical protein
MKVLGWYTFFLNTAIILLLLLTAAGIASPPPFTWFETLVWVIFTVPVLILGWITAKTRK